MNTTEHKRVLDMSNALIGKINDCRKQLGLKPLLPVHVASECEAYCYRVHDTETGCTEAGTLRDIWYWLKGISQAVRICLAAQTRAMDKPTTSTSLCRSENDSRKDICRVENMIVRTMDGYVFYRAPEGQYWDDPREGRAEEVFNSLEELVGNFGPVQDLTNNLNALYSAWELLADVPTTSNEYDELVIDEAFMNFHPTTTVEYIGLWFEARNRDFVVGEILQGKRRTPHEGRQVRVLVDDRCGRYRKGAVGTVLPCDSSKYDYKVDLGEIKNPNPLDKAFGSRNVIYFYQDELEIMEGS